VRMSSDGAVIARPKKPATDPGNNDCCICIAKACYRQ
jgi:hypothetical protein